MNRITDLRKSEPAVGQKSKNFVFSSEAVAIFEKIDLDSRILAVASPLHAKMVHHVDGRKRTCRLDVTSEKA